jgi:hypothetical protein
MGYLYEACDQIPDLCHQVYTDNVSIAYCCYHGLFAYVKLILFLALIIFIVYLKQNRVLIITRKDGVEHVRTTWLKYKKTKTKKKTTVDMVACMSAFPRGMNISKSINIYNLSA